MKVLIFAAHPDDEVMGLAGTITKHIKQGDKVYLSIITDGVFAKYFGQDKFDLLKKRKEDCMKVGKFLGIKEIIFHDLPDAKLDTLPQLELNKLLEKDINKIKPQRVYTHYSKEIHTDHSSIFYSTIVATRKKVKEIYCYEIIGSTQEFNPNCYVDISKELKDKLKAMSLYKSTLEKFPNPISVKSIKTLAEYRGIESGLNAAEAFIIYKRIEK